MTYDKTIAFWCSVLLLSTMALSNPSILNGQTATPNKTNELPNDVSLFKRMIGKWDSTVRIWSGKPGDPAVESKGVSEFQFVLNGQFLKESHTRKMGDKEITGIGYWGYDKTKKKFTRTWMDSLTTRSVIAEGTLDQKLKALTYYGRVDDSKTGQHDKMMRYELDFSDPNKVLFKIYDLSIHKDAKVFEAVYVKQVPPPSNSK